MSEDRIPTGGYFLVPEFHLWPDVRAAGAEAIGTYVAFGIWATSHDYNKALPPDWLRLLGSTPEAAEGLVRTRLWRETSRGYKPVTLAQLRTRRGRRGLIMLISRLLPSSAEASDAGIGALGAWSLAASWSLSTPRPGFIPREAVEMLGIEQYALPLCKANARWEGLWKRAHGGYQMTDGDHPHELRWKVVRDDRRALIPDDVRDAVYARDGHRCVKCGSPDDLALDHIYPWSRGGPDTQDNLQMLCRSCNSRKRDRVETHARRRQSARTRPGRPVSRPKEVTP